MRLLKIVILFSIISGLISCEKIEPDNASINTVNATSVTAYSATSGGHINPDGSLPVLSRGVCWSPTQNPTIAYHFSTYSVDGDGFGSYTSNIPELNAGRTYYVRAYYTNAKDTVYGDEIEFTTPDYIQFNPDLVYGTVSDIDGNVYKTVKIGNQTWMAENLRTTRYQNGDPISHVKDADSWSFFGKKEGAYCFYNYDNAKAEIYGAYYDWFAASDPRNVAPEGWRVATEEDWEALKEYAYFTYGGNFASALRETTSAHWILDPSSSPNDGNQTGFTALGADRAMTSTDSFWYKGNYGYFWTSTGSVDFPIYALLRNDLSLHPDQNYKGFSIRCVKD